MSDTISHTTTLDPEKLSEEFDRYPFAKIIPPTSRELKPDEIRPDIRSKLKDGEKVLRTTPRKVEIDRDKLCELEYHIRQCWTVRQIEHFYPFLHGGRFKSDAGWERGLRGYATQTNEEDTALTRLFDQLRDTCNNLIGAASALEMNGAEMIGGYCFVDGRGNEPSLIDCTLNQLRDKLPEGLQERIEKETKPLADELKATQGMADKRKDWQGGTDRKNAKLKKEIAKLKTELAKVTKERDAARAELLKAKGLI